ncbi:MAG: hypothetical protein MUF68_05265 [Cyclobacteriaceae bacterium]|jgi:magnesium-transporting ATPase (P-type)|nr:hypothetical protein [Cyclobacteriaceae bacterium]
MKNFRDMFQKLSYLQYPLMALSLFFLYRPMLLGLNNIIEDFNIGLVFMGLGITFSTLQDTKKTQNKLSEKIWKSKKYSKWLITYFLVLIFILLGLAMFWLFSEDTGLQGLSWGVLSVAMGLMGIVKAGLEMAEYQQSKVE